jgi:chromosome partitioning protein
MRIRRRDRGETPSAEQAVPAEPERFVAPIVVPPTPTPSAPPVAAEPKPESPPAVVSPPVVEPPPPFDQALLSPTEPEVTPTFGPRPSPAAAPPAPAPVATPTPPPVATEPTPFVPPEPEANEPPTPWAPDPEPLVDSTVIERVAEPKYAAAAPVAPPEPATQMRTPSIRSEANALLDGARPAPRELPRVIAIANQKGGVGKTTTTVNLGAALAEIGYRVLVIDLDPQGNATTGLGIDARNFELSMYDVIMREQSLEDCIEPTSVKNLFVAPATIDLAGIEIELVPAFSREMKLKKAIDTVVDDFDFILIDCPPSLGLITVNGLAAAGEVMVPIQCEYYALEGLSQLLRNVNLVSSNLNETLEVTTIVLTMFDARTRLSIEVANEVRLHFADRVCKSVIPRTVRLSEAPSFGQPITVFDPTSRGAVAYRELAKEVSNGAPQRTR